MVLMDRKQKPFPVLSLMPQGQKVSVLQCRVGGTPRQQIIRDLAQELAVFPMDRVLKAMGTLADPGATLEQTWALGAMEQAWDRERTWVLELANSEHVPLTLSFFKKTKQKNIPAAGLGQGGYPQGVAGKTAGYGDGAAGYAGAGAVNSLGADATADSKALSTGYGTDYGAGSNGYGAGLGAGGYGGQGQAALGALGAGMESTGGKYGGVGQPPYGGAPVIPTGLDGDGGYPYSAQHLSLGADAGKTSKYGYAGQLGTGQDAYGGQGGKYGGLNGLGNGYKAS
ncbi:spidroin-1 [Myripristis murdjan]|uniref:spidroin-1 n=1 Tax=Myripristis murdjan TaxID=586833 RepID=UPI001175E130|nr:spidroin-1-like [Myripristis murdjan]